MFKLFLVTSLLVTSAYGAEKKQKMKSFDEIKSRALKNVDQRLAAVTAHRSCIKSAKDKNALAKCRETNKAEMKKLLKKKKVKN